MDESSLLTMRTILDIVELVPVEVASILKGPSWNPNFFSAFILSKVPQIKLKYYRECSGMEFNFS